jgi:hypothetical protein
MNDTPWRHPFQSAGENLLKRKQGVVPQNTVMHAMPGPRADSGRVLLDPAQTSRQLQADDLARASFMKRLQLAMTLSMAAAEEAAIAEATRQSLELSATETAQRERWRVIVTSRCAELKCTPTPIEEDGNCQFNAVLVSAGLLDQITHEELRENVCQYISDMGSSVTDFMPGLINGRAPKSFK